MQGYESFGAKVLLRRSARRPARLTALALAALLSACATPAPEPAAPPPPAAKPQPAAPKPTPKPAPAPEPIAPALAPLADGFVPLQRLARCPRITVVNAPPADADGWLTTYSPFRKVEGVRLLTAPVAAACFSSGYGPRNGKSHRGIDLQGPRGTAVVAAASGEVLEAVWRADFGNMVVIDHGRGVFTRYAHLDQIAGDIKAAAKVRAGERIGGIGDTSSFKVAVHLHYEVLTGNYATAKKSFGLTPRSIFDYPSTD